MQFTPMNPDEHSPNLQLGLLMPAQAQKHVTVNESLLRLDALVQTRVQSRQVGQQPGTPAYGQAWILPSGADGPEWSAMQAGSLAVFRDGFWTEIPPQHGWRAFILDEGQQAFFTDAGWRLAAEIQCLAEGRWGAATQAIVIERQVELTGESVITDAIIPARSVVFCVSTRTLDTIEGCARFDCGIAGEAAKFGGSLSVHAGAENLGVIGPTAFYADTPVVMTAREGAFSAGRAGIAIHAWMPRAMPADA